MQFFRTQGQGAFDDESPGIEYLVSITDGLQEGTPFFGRDPVATETAPPLPAQQRVELFHPA
jgi:hypothetical protein